MLPMRALECFCDYKETMLRYEKFPLINLLVDVEVFRA